MAQSLAQANSSTTGKIRDTHIAGVLLAFSGTVMFLLTSLSETLYANYSIHNNAISDLAATTASTTAIEETAGFMWGLCWLLGSYLLLRKTGRRGFLALNLLPGIGVLLAILSPENVNVAIHSIGAVVAFIPGAISAILSYKLIDSKVKYFSVILGAISLIAVIVEFGAYNSTLVQQTLGVGGTERIIVYPLLAWLMIFGGYLTGAGRQQ